jgi:hypothetical protein
MGESTRAVWEIAQQRLDKLLTKRARKSRFKELCQPTASGYMDIPTALEYGVLMAEFKSHQKVTAKEMEEMMYTAAALGELKTSINVDGVRIDVPASAFHLRN